MKSLALSLLYSVQLLLWPNLSLAQSALVGEIIVKEGVLEFFTVPSVGTSQVSVSFQQTYASVPVVVCTGEVDDENSWAPTIRLDDISSTGMKVNAVRLASTTGPTDLGDQSDLYVGNVHCFVSLAGSHSLGTGVNYIAGTVESDGLMMPQGKILIVMPILLVPNLRNRMF